jgi:hypothetical protein
MSGFTWVWHAARLRLDTADKPRSRRPGDARRGSPTHAWAGPCAQFFGVLRRGTRSRTHRPPHPNEIQVSGPRVARAVGSDPSGGDPPCGVDSNRRERG